MTAKASIHIDRQNIIGEVDDYLYGANLEHIGQSIYGGIWAEMLRDRKFAGHDYMYLGASEGLSNTHPSAGIVVPWEAVNPDYEAVLFVHDNTIFYTGQQSQRITIRQSDNLQHGIQQKGLYLHAQTHYDVRLVLKGEAQAVTITLGDAHWVIDAVSEDWATYETTLIATRSHTDGALQITIDVGNLWVGCASLMPSNNVEGFRADVLDALRDWHPTFLRWPGGNFVSAYHWQDGIGDRDKRSSYLDPAWSQWESHDMGTDEFMILCDLVDCDPLLTINMGNGTVEEAAAWVEYCNGNISTEYGALRAANGHTEPYQLKTWFVGNEQFGNWQVGHVDAETYARKYLDYAGEMRAKDSDLILIAVGVPTDLYGHWNELVLKTADHTIDQLSVHYYSIRTEKRDVPPPPEQLYLPKIAASHEVEQMLDDTLAIIDQFSNRQIPIAFDEWNTYCGAKSPDFIEAYNLADALYAGALMNACIQRADRIKMSAVFNLINVMACYLVYPLYQWQAVNLGRGGGWIPIDINAAHPEPVTVKMPTTLVLELMTRYRGKVAVDCAVESPTFASPAEGNLPAYDAIPCVQAATTYDETTQTIYLSIVNRSVEDDMQITLSGIAETATIQRFTIAGESPLSTNDYDNPTHIQIVEDQVSLDNIVLSPHSFCLLAIKEVSFNK